MPLVVVRRCTGSVRGKETYPWINETLEDELYLPRGSKPDRNVWLSWTTDVQRGQWLEHPLVACVEVGI